MTLHLHSCERADSPTGRMSAAEFAACLPRIAHAKHWFADYTGTNPRTVERWHAGQLDIPAWVPRLLRLHARLTEALTWSEDHGDVPAREIVWRAETRDALWEKDHEALAGAARRRQEVHHVDGNPRNSAPGNLVIVDREAT